jgi:hypothetical protein
MGCAAFSADAFFLRPVLAREAGKGACGRGHAEGREVHGASSLQFLIVSNQLSPEPRRARRPRASHSDARGQAVLQERHEQAAQRRRLLFASLQMEMQVWLRRPVASAGFSVGNWAATSRSVRCSTTWRMVWRRPRRRWTWPAGEAALALLPPRQAALALLPSRQAASALALLMGAMLAPPAGAMASAWWPPSSRAAAGLCLP